MKIILTDNYNRETMAEFLLYENLHPWIANFMIEPLRKRYHHTHWWPTIREDNYRLWRGMEDLV